MSYIPGRYRVEAFASGFTTSFSLDLSTLPPGKLVLEFLAVTAATGALNDECEFRFNATGNHNSASNGHDNGSAFDQTVNDGASKTGITFKAMSNHGSIPANYQDAMGYLFCPNFKESSHKVFVYRNIYAKNLIGNGIIANFGAGMYRATAAITQIEMRVIGATDNLLTPSFMRARVVP